jgi:hypothetical protein
VKVLIEQLEAGHSQGRKTLRVELWRSPSGSRSDCTHRHSLDSNWVSDSHRFPLGP